jgi:hypothetical protein
LEGVALVAATDTVVGKYRIERTIARANSTVYEGVDPVMGRRVALKELALPAGLPDPLRERRVERFEADARAAGSLTHPNIVTILGVFAEHDRHFLLMEYLDGGTVREALDKYGAIPPAKALWIALQMCEGLGYAHSRGMIHGEVGPDSIHVLPTGQVKITGFGCDRAGDKEHFQAAARLPAGIAHMSPEQITERAVDLRTDVFAVGAVLYEMLTGMAPFDAATPEAIARLICHAPPPVPESVAASLRPILLRALAADPESRYPWMAAMASDLRQERLAFEAKPTLAFRPSPPPADAAQRASPAPVSSVAPPSLDPAFAILRAVPREAAAPQSGELAAPARPARPYAVLRPRLPEAVARPRSALRDDRRLARGLVAAAGIVAIALGAVVAGLHPRGAAEKALPMASAAVYNNGLASGWKLAAGPDGRISGNSGHYAVSVRTAHPYDRLAFQNPAFNPTGYKALSFWIDGGTSGCYNLWVRGLLPSGSPMRSMYPIPPLTPNKWVHEEIDLSALAMDRTPGCSGFCIQDQTGQSGQRFSVADIRFVRGS